MSAGRSSSVFSILYFPDEILMEIIVYLNATERVALAHSSNRFDSLVFGEKKLLRDLDFSEEGRHTSPIDIRRYFTNEKRSKHILRLNLRNVNCMEPGKMLNDYISKASNLVDINIHGTEIRDILQLGSLLNVLIHVQRLSIDWPKAEVNDDVHAVLHQPFGRLNYLSVILYASPNFAQFFKAIKLCQELKELHIVQKDRCDSYIIRTRPEPLKNLEILSFCGTKNRSLENYSFGLRPDSEKWTYLPLINPLGEIAFYLDKNVNISDELKGSKYKILRIRYARLFERIVVTPGFGLHLESLLKAVIRITQEKVPKEFCSSEFTGGERCGLKIEDLKQLLMNPRHQIKCLYLKNSIGTECDVHLFALACPSLTELYLYDVMKIKKSTASKQSILQGRIGWKHNPMHWEQTYLTTRCLIDSSFKMFIENTPHVKDLTLNGKPGKLEDDEAWDLGALQLIPRWINLKSLRLLYLPISNGEFLIEIGKQCTFLQKLELDSLGSSDVCCYTKELTLMLRHCRNLTDFSINAKNIGPLSEVFFSLAKNLKLRRVHLISTGEQNYTANLISSIEQLLRCCPNLTTFVCIIDQMSEAYSTELTSALRRLRGQLKRPTFHFQVTRKLRTSHDVYQVQRLDDTAYDDFSNVFLINFGRS